MTWNAVKWQNVFGISNYIWFKENYHKNHDYNSF